MVLAWKASNIFAININSTNEELIKELAEVEYRYSRVPVYEETIDNIIGIIYIKDVLKSLNNQNLDVQNMVKEAYFISQNRLINEVFKELQQNKKQLAVIVDEYGGTAGIVTMEDIIHLQNSLGSLREYGNFFPFSYLPLLRVPAGR